MYQAVIQALMDFTSDYPFGDEEETENEVEEKQTMFDDPMRRLEKVAEIRRRRRRQQQGQYQGQKQQYHHKINNNQISENGSNRQRWLSLRVNEDMNRERRLPEVRGKWSNQRGCCAERKLYFGSLVPKCIFFNRVLVYAF